MRKLYRAYFEGQSSNDWDTTWNKYDVARTVEAVSVGHYYLNRPFNKYLKKGLKILEGGCGVGQYVIYFHREAYDIVGIDFAENTINRIREFDSRIPVKVANVLDLPFEDDTFDIYYSGGVVEHFEEGPERALQEAYRVLKPGGLLLITVPFVNYYRSLEDAVLKLKAFLRNEKVYSKKRRFGHHVDDEYLIVNNTRNGNSPGFHLYAFNAKEFRRILENERLRILECHGTNISYGLRDSNFFHFWMINYQKELESRSNNRTQQIEEECDRLSVQQARPNLYKKLKSRVRDIIFWEKSKSITDSIILRVLQETFGNLVLFVCSPNK